MLTHARAMLSDNSVKILFLYKTINKGVGAGCKRVSGQSGQNSALSYEHTQPCRVDHLHVLIQVI